MDKITQLWIRACKVENSAKRCESVLRRFYMGGVLSDADIKTGIIIHLSDIVDEYCPMKTIDLISKMEEPPAYYKDTRDYRTKARDTLINRIRRTEKVVFEGLISPLRWRK